MNTQRLKHRTAAALVAVLAFYLGVTSAQRRDVAVAGRDVTILVTVHPHNDRLRASADQLQPDDFAVREEKRPQRIISVKRPTEAPPILAALIQDDLVSRVNNEMKGIKEFIRRLPEGSRVMTGYLTVGTLSVAQDFTTDRERAAESLHIVRSSESAAPYNPYIEVIEALRRFDAQPAGRRMVLLVSDGLDVSRGFRDASPTLSIDLDRAIREAQRRGVAVFTFYAPSVGLTSVSWLEGQLRTRFAHSPGGRDGRRSVLFRHRLCDLRSVLQRVQRSARSPVDHHLSQHEHRLWLPPHQGHDRVRSASALSCRLLGAWRGSVAPMSGAQRVTIS